MKTKIYKILGVALTLVLLASLTVGLAGAPAGAASSNLKFTKLKLQQVEDWGVPGSEGDYWCTPNTDVGPIATSAGGDLFACLNVVDPELMKSTTDGYGWKMMDGFWQACDNNGDHSAIVDIVTSPEYDDDETVFVATTWFVYQSVDGGDTWAVMPAAWGAEAITDLDVTMDDKGRITLMVCTAGPGPTGDVYIYGSKTLTWVAQQIDDGNPGGPFPVAVLAGGFSPFFPDDEFFAAVVTNNQDDGSGGPGTTQVQFAITPTTDGTPAPWGGTYGVARVRDADDLGFPTNWARMAYPDDFAASGIGNNTIFAGLYAGPTGTGYGGFERGDVYQVSTVEGPFSQAVDLDIRGEVSTLLPTPTNIVSLDVVGNAEDCHIMVGTDYIDFSSSPYYFLTYRSEDGGESWMPSMKAPTGGDLGAGFYNNAWTQVLFAYDYLSSGIAYAGTMGDETSAFSRSANNGATFNQISLMDYGDDGVGPVGYGVAWLDATGYNATDTVHIVTQFSDGQGYDPSGAVFQTTNGGENWERVFSYANPFVNPNIAQVWRVGDEAIFTVNFAVEVFWRSSDMGETWMKKITNNKAGGLSAAKFVSETEIWMGFGDGSMWWSENSGATWDKPEENPMTAPVLVIVPMGPNVLVSTFNGVFFSSDGAETLERVGSPGEPGPGFGLCLPDLAFDANNMVYLSTPFFLGGVQDDGVWRAEIDSDDPTESEWVRIDDNQEATGPVVYDETTVDAGGPPLCLPPSGILYVIDGWNVDTGDVSGGLWRSTNPTADVDSAHPPYFEKENKGLMGNGFGPAPADPNPNDDDWLQWLSLDVFPTTLFCLNGNAANYWEQVVLFTDILDVGVPLAMPEADATGVGLLPEGYVYPEVVLAWEEMAGASGYQYQVAIDPDFKTTIPVPNNGFTTSLASAPLELQPNSTYYWHVRVAADGSLIGAPLISPWSDTWKFKTAIGASMARPDLQAPWPGEPDVPLSPTFEWSGIEWADYYEYELALDPTTTAGGYFTEPLVALVGTNALVSTAWKCDMTLEYNTRYYWHVKAIGVDTDTPWSDVGTFTTMGVPPEPPEAQPPVVIPPAEQITPAWIWAIVIIGAILVIAVIVLIVTTRRVP
jgi:photosystem II stability/assembly factor-like uncharacterized protein